MTASRVPLVRFVTGGLLATLDSHLAGTLPLHRLSWELAARIDTLAELDPPRRTLTRLRWLQRAVANLQADLVATGRRQPTPAERESLIATLDTLRTVLATLAPHDPVDPAGAARRSRARAA